VPQLEIHHAHEDKQLGIIRGITQDDTGFLWIAASTGLYKYDGAEFKHIPLPGSANLYDILKDHQGNIWIATLDKGLYKLSPSTQQLKVFQSNNSLLPSNHLSKLSLHKSKIWIATNNGIALFNTDSQTFETPSLHWPTELQHTSIVDTAMDNSGWLWILTFEKGLYRWHKQTNQLLAFNAAGSGAQLIANHKASSLFIDDSSNVWLAGFNGIEIYNHQQGRFSQVRAFTNIAINGIEQDQQGDYWITTWSQGLYHIAKSQLQEPDLSQLQSSLIMADAPFSDTFEDKHKNLWFSSENKLFKLSSLSRALSHYQLQDARPCPVKGFNQFNTQELIFGCGHYIYRSTPEQQLNFNRVAEVNNEIYAITKLDNNTSLISFFRENYLASYNKQNQRLNYYHPHQNGSGLNGGVPLDMVTDSQSRVWVGTYAAHLKSKFGHLYLYDKQADRFIPHLSQINVLSIVELDPDNLLLVTPDGPVRYQISSKSLITNPNLDTHISRVNDIYRDNEGLIWISIFEKGLYQIDSKNLLLIRFKPDSNIPLSEITGLSEDSQGNIWMVSENGLIKYNKRQDNLSFSKEDSSGYIKKYSRNNALTTADGKLLFSGKNAFLSFNGLQIDLSTKLNLAISEFKITDRDSRPRIINNINQRPQVTLSYTDQFFSVKVSPLDYSKRSNFRYFFKLEGLNSQWIEMNRLSKDAVFTTLAAGEYKFLYKAIANNQEFYGQAINIKVTPAPWLTPQAYGCYLLLLLASIYLVINLRTRALQKHSYELEKRVEERTQCLIEKTQTVQKLLDEKKQLFANISHEFRTPLSLILGPIEMLKHQQLSTEGIQHVEVAMENAKRLSKILDQTLELAKLDNFAQLRPTRYKLKTSIQEIMLLFQDEASTRQIKLELQAPCQLEVILLQDSLEKIIANLLSNALKYSRNGTKIQLKVSHQGQVVNIEVADKGIGISTQELERIFSPFTRLAAGNNMSTDGSGLGLTIVKELVEINGGDVQVHSQPGVGSRFIVQLPLTSQNILDQGTKYQDLSQFTHDLIRHRLEFTSPAQKLTADNKTVTTEITSQKAEILIIEDNNQLRQFIASRLTSKFNVLQAEHGISGIELAMRHIPDLIICDIMMDGLDGYQVTQELRNNDKTSHIPIIILTARVDQDSKLKGWQSQADEYMTKPFSVTELQIRIQNLLSIRKLLREQAGYQLSHRQPDLAQCGSRDRSFIEKFEKAIASQYQNPELRRAHIAKSLALSERQLNRKLSSLVNNSFSDYLRKYRLRKAVELFGQGLQVNQLCYEVGFNTPSYFISCFKEEFGMTVKEYEQQLIQEKA